MSCHFLFRACLALVPNSEHSVKEETDLICALSMFTDYKVSILPLQGTQKFHQFAVPASRSKIRIHFVLAVRLCQDKLNLIEKVLDSSPHSYKDAGKVRYDCVIFPW